MSEAAIQQRTRRRVWAAPGGRHDRLVGFLQIALPCGIGVLAAFLAVAPLRQTTELNFLLQRENVTMAPERMRVEEARYSGADSEGNRFRVRAGSAVQRRSTDPVVRLEDLAAEMRLPSGRAVIVANDGRYNMTTQIMALDGPLAFRTEDGYSLSTRDVLVDLNSQRMHSQGPVEGEIPLGTFSANSMTMNMRDRTVNLEGRARLNIVQGVGR